MIQRLGVQGGRLRVPMALERSCQHLHVSFKVPYTCVLGLGAAIGVFFRFMDVALQGFTGFCQGVARILCARFTAV